MKKFIIRMHGKWYDIPEEKFNLIFYNCMLFYKTAIMFSQPCSVSGTQNYQLIKTAPGLIDRMLFLL